MNTIYKALKTIEGFTKSYKRISHIKTALSVTLAIYTVFKLASSFGEAYKCIKGCK